MRELVQRAITIIEAEREVLFSGHQVNGVVTVDEAVDQEAADAISDMDAWLTEARAALQAPQEAGVCATDGCDNEATGRFESGGVGSHHCPDCLTKIAALSQPVAQAVPSEVVGAKTLDEWHEDDGDVCWWALDESGQWLGEPAYIGSPLDLGRAYSLTIGEHEFVATLGGWPGYHTHWTPHPAFPTPPASATKGGA